MPEPKLKPCPFCEGNPDYEKRSIIGGKRSVKIICKKCHCSTPEVEQRLEYSAMDKVAEIWNRRAYETDSTDSEKEN